MQPAAVPRRLPKVWATSVDSKSELGSGAISSWESGSDTEWAVPEAAVEGDYVLLWNGDRGEFRLILKIDGEPREPVANELPPRWANLSRVGTIDPGVQLHELRTDPELWHWWPVRSEMRNLAAAQRRSFSDDAPWPAFVSLLSRVAPAAADRLAELMRPERATSSIAVNVQDDGSEGVRSLTVTSELAGLLARSAAINAKRDGFDLSFSSLMLAVLHGADPLGRWLAGYFERQQLRTAHLLSKVGKSATDAQAAAAKSTEERDVLLASTLRRTESARRALDEASAMASAQQAVLGAPHLMLALIGINNYHEADFKGLGLDRAKCGADFLGHLSQRVSAREMGFWKQHYRQRFGFDAVIPEAAARLTHRPDFDADAYTSKDLLSIEDEVAALAYVIASKRTVPPLAIGLFGEWGSGKTFFMSHLRKRIEDLAAGARGQKPVAARECLGNIAQIEFNAWHYQEGDLWASLVDHILRNLRFGEDEDAAKVNERRKLAVHELEDIEARQEAAAQRATVADNKVKAAEQTVTEKQTEEQSKREALAQALVSKPALQAIRKGTTLDAETVARGRALMQQLQIDVALGSAEELRDALSGARQELASVLAFLVPLFRAQDRLRRVLLLLAAAVIPIIAAVAVLALMREPGLLARLSTWIGTGVAAAGLVAQWLRSQTAWVKGIREQVSAVAVKVDQEFAAAVEQELADQKKAVADAMSALDVAVQERTRAETERDQAAAQANAVKLRLATLGDEGLMRAFLDERIGGGTYQQKLGTAALVRRDFDALSRKIIDVTKREISDEVRPEELLINRIVLYIDDLDRCEMSKVVPVLRAVHLLLAFKAFVVVVGVDSRWVARCLQKHHEEIFADAESDDGRRVTPLDYLEKIFQIPIWLEPVPPEGRASMVRELLRPRKDVPDSKGAQDNVGHTQQANTGASSQPAGATGQQGQPAVTPAPSQGGVTTTGAEGQEKGQPGPQAPAPARARGKTLDLNPSGMDITDGEYAFIEHLGPLLSASPRALKRFVNTYRLVNVSLAAQPDGGSETPSEAEIRMFLLAVLVAMPEFSFVLQAALRREDADLEAPLVEVVEFMWTQGAAGVDRSVTNRARRQWDDVHKWLASRGSEWTSMPASRLQRWIDQVGRYTFNLTRAAAVLTRPPARKEDGERLAKA